jgi:hypothetical protein
LQPSSHDACAASGSVLCAGRLQQRAAWHAKPAPSAAQSPFALHATSQIAFVLAPASAVLAARAWHAAPLASELHVSSCSHHRVQAASTQRSRSPQSPQHACKKSVSPVPPAC